MQNGTQMDKAIQWANDLINGMSVDDLKQYAFDRLVTEYLYSHSWDADGAPIIKSREL